MVAIDGWNSFNILIMNDYQKAVVLMKNRYGILLTRAIEGDAHILLDFLGPSQAAPIHFRRGP